MAPTGHRAGSRSQGIRGPQRGASNWGQQLGTRPQVGGDNLVGDLSRQQVPGAHQRRGLISGPNWFTHTACEVGRTRMDAVAAPARRSETLPGAQVGQVPKSIKWWSMATNKQVHCTTAVFCSPILFAMVDTMLIVICIAMVAAVALIAIPKDVWNLIG